MPSALATLCLALTLCGCVECGDGGASGVTAQSCGHRCVDGTCIDAALVCDGKEDCADGTDEHTTVTCKMPVFNAAAAPCARPDEYQCYDGACIDHSKVCDRKFDCADETDEAHVIACD